jgi:hypothetical protein
LASPNFFFSQISEAITIIKSFFRYSLAN